MHDKITVMCCCCKKKVQVGENPLQRLAELVGWVSIERKSFCGSCVAGFTEEDWDWLTETPVPLRLAEVGRLMPGDVEPL